MEVNMLYDDLKSLTTSCKTIKEISKVINLSETTVKYWLKKHNLKIIKPTVYEKLCSCCKTVKPLLSFYLKSKKNKTHNSYCKECSKVAVTSSKKSYKQDCVNYKGGSCAHCGYNKYIGALEFHHLESEEKEFELSRKTSLTKEVKSELDKCLLVCSNCHREIHGGIDKN